MSEPIVDAAAVTEALPAQHSEMTATVETAAKHEESGNSLFQTDPGLIIWVWVTFLLLLVVLGKFAWKPILTSLDEREARIRKSLEDAEKAVKTLEEAELKRQDIIKQAQGKAAQIVSESMKRASDIAIEIESSARSEEQRLLKQARDQITAETAAAIARIRREAADLAIGAAEGVLLEKLDDAKSRELVKTYISKMTA